MGIGGRAENLQSVDRYYQMMMCVLRCLTMLLLVSVLCTFSGVSAHGYMELPAARNCMWRFGFPNPPDYSDNQCFCGGIKRMWKKNHGACGVCGDAADDPKQSHNDGGRWGNKIIAKTYKSGQTIDITVRLTTSHKGTFEFRVGDFSNSKTTGDSLGKLKGELLHIVGGGTKFVVPTYRKGLYKLKLKLPTKLKCSRFVLQWWYRGGNNWGCDKDGCGQGHGPQEHFVNCADVTIE